MNDENYNQKNSLNRSSQSSKGSASQKSMDSLHSDRLQESDESDSEEISIIPIHGTEINLSQNSIKNNINHISIIYKEKSSKNDNFHEGNEEYINSSDTFKNQIDENRIDKECKYSQTKYPQLSRKVKKYNQARKLKNNSKIKNIIKGTNIIKNLIMKQEIHWAIVKLRNKIIKTEKLDFIPRFLSLRSYQMKIGQQPSNVIKNQNYSRSIKLNKMKRNKNNDLQQSIMDKVKNLLLSKTPHYYRNPLINKASTFHYFGKHYPLECSKSGIENNTKIYQHNEGSENEIFDEDAINKNFKDSRIKMTLNQINNNTNYNDIKQFEKLKIENENKPSNSIFMIDNSSNTIDIVPYLKVKSLRTLESSTLKLKNNRSEEKEFPRKCEVNEISFSRKTKDKSFELRKSFKIAYHMFMNNIHNNISQSPIRTNHKSIYK